VKQCKGVPALVLAVLLAAATPAAAPSAASSGADDFGCGISGGTLTMLATDNESDFAAFGLYNAVGNELARQYIPMYTSDASAELMLSKIGFGGGASVASVKCLADSSLSRCPDPKWAPIDEGVGIAISGVLLGPDWIVVAIKGHYVNVASPIAGTIDGASAGFQLDKAPVRWSSFYDSQTEASQAFFDLPNGPHQLTLGSRDTERDTLLPQERLCFNT